MFNKRKVVLTKMWIYGFLPKLVVKNAYFHDFEKCQGGRNLSDQHVVVTSKRAQGLYFRWVQLLSSYLEPWWKNRNFKILRKWPFWSVFWPFILHFSLKNVKNVFFLNCCIDTSKTVYFMSTIYERNARIYKHTSILDHVMPSGLVDQSID